MGYNDSQPMVPTSNGTLFQTSQYLRYLEAGDITFWILYLQQQKYFTNLFSIEGDEAFSKVEPLFFSTLWNYGSCFVKKIGDRFGVFTLSQKETNIDGTFKSGKCILTTGFNDTNYADEDYSNRSQYKFDDKDGAYCKFNDYAFPAIMFWWKWLMVSKQILDAITTSIRSINTKIGYETNNPDSPEVLDNITRMMDPATYISVISKAERRGKASADADKIVEIKASQPDGCIRAIESLQKWEGWVGSQLGRRDNTSFKKERNISNEVELEESNFNIVEMEMYKYLKNFCNDMNTLYNLNLRVVYNLEASKDNDEEVDNATDK